MAAEKFEALTDTGRDWEEQARNWIAWARRPLAEAGLA